MAGLVHKRKKRQTLSARGKELEKCNAKKRRREELLEARQRRLCQP
jgi:hypothetical protein